MNALESAGRPPSGEGIFFLDDFLEAVSCRETEKSGGVCKMVWARARARARDEEGRTGAWSCVWSFDNMCEQKQNKKRERRKKKKKKKKKREMV